MSTREYTLAVNRGPAVTRRGHVLRITLEGAAPFDLALHRVSGGYAVDHPRSGYSLKALNQTRLFGPRVTLAEAKVALQESVKNLTLDHLARLTEAPTLNEGFLGPG